MKITKKNKDKRLILEAKQVTWKDFEENLERDIKGNQKLFYRVLKKLRKNNKEEMPAIQNEMGEILTDETEIMMRWKEYCMNVLEVRREEGKVNIDRK